MPSSCPRCTNGTFPALDGSWIHQRARTPFLPRCAWIPRLATISNPQRDGKSREGWLRMRHADQEWRLAYVATTRARTHLYLSGAHWYGTPEPNKRAVKPSRLIDIARELRGSIVDAWSDEPGDRPLTLRFPPAQAGPDPAFGTTWDDALRRTLADPQWPRQRARDLDVVDLYDSAVEELQQSLFALPDQVETKLDPAETRVSVTGLVTYADCPKRFYWSEVDRLPRRPSSAARRGVELHRRIELYSRGNRALRRPDRRDIRSRPRRSRG